MSRSREDQEKWFEEQYKRLIAEAGQRGVTVRDLARYLATGVGWLIYTNVPARHRHTAVWSFSEAVRQSVEISAVIEPKRGADS